MDRFVVRDNISRLRDRLISELDPAQRARLQRLLVEEEDKLVADLALLDDVDRELDRATMLIARQSALVRAMERDGHDDVQQAKSLLRNLEDSQNLHDSYRRNVLAAIKKNELL